MVILPDQFALAALGPAMPDAALIDQVVRSALDDTTATVLDASAAPVEYDFTSIATAGLFRVSGSARTATGPRPWSVFVKLLQHPRHWAYIDLVPLPWREEMLTVFPWREEVTTREQVLPVLPRGLRVPQQYAEADLGEDRVALWMEDIDVDTAPWPTEAYAHAAHLLGALAARRTPDQPAGRSPFAPGFAIRALVASRLPGVAARLADDAVWADPAVAGLVDAGYRRDLSRVVEATPALLDEMDALPQSLPHGDACPANLLRPCGEPGVLVAIDWSFGTPAPLGFDLGQLVVGEVEGGREEPARVTELIDVVVPAYGDALRAAGCDVPDALVLRGCAMSLATRTLPGVHPLGEGDDDPVARRRSAGLGRVALDVVLGSVRAFGEGA